MKAKSEHVFGQALSALARFFISFRFRYDVFISYKRGEASDYSFKLKEQLEALDY